MNSERFFGVTPPISTVTPTPKEIQATKDLVQELHDQGLFESPKEASLRITVLGKLNTLFKEFVRNVSLRNNMPESIANEAGGKVFSFGSYRLGVHGKGSDIDTLCVAPKHVKREDFFTEMYETLKSRPEVTEIAAVSDAYVPVIKFVFSDIPIDLIFARLALPSVPENLSLLDNSLLRNLDERGVRSLNGSRVTDEMLNLVPNIESFRIALRCIKLWAKKRAIYANVFGFFGGVAWALVVARVCQLYPNAAAGTIISKFFRIMQQWNWPQPVLLKPIEEGILGLRVWNPKIYIQDKAHRMPVITPAYPSMCATHNVTASTQLVKLREFGLAAQVTDRIFIGQATWKDLFKKHDFFYQYKYYMQVIASSNSTENQLIFSGMVESKLRQLVMKLEMIEDIEIAHPFIKGYDNKFICRTEQERELAQLGKLQQSDSSADESLLKSTESLSSLKEDELKDESIVKDEIKEESLQEIKQETDIVNEVEKEIEQEVEVEQDFPILTTCLYIGISIKPKDKGKNRKLDLSWPVMEFKKIVTSWDKYDETCMGIHVEFLKSSQLPDDVFEGESRVDISANTKKLKKKKKRSEEDETCVNEAKRAKLLPQEEPELTSNGQTMAVTSDKVPPVGTMDSTPTQQQPVVVQDAKEILPSSTTIINGSSNGTTSTNQQKEIPLGIKATMGRKGEQIKLKM